MVPDNSTYDVVRMQRSRAIPSVEQQLIRYCSPENLILKKLEFYQEGGSDKHLRDIDGMIRVQKVLDWAYLDQWAVQMGVDSIWNTVKSKHHM